MRQLLIILTVSAVVSCTNSKPAGREFLDISESAGIRLAANESAGLASTPFNLMDITGGGVGVLDADADGDLDLVFVQGSSAVSPDGAASSMSADEPVVGMWLFRNLSRPQSIRFEAVTTGWPAIAGGAGMGVAIGDVNNDGVPDIYVTTSAADRLLVGTGDGRYYMTQSEQVPEYSQWSVSASMVDINVDGLLDIVTGGLVALGDDAGKRCYSPSGSADYCFAVDFSAAPDRVLINNSTSTQLGFSNETESWGIDKLAVHTAGVTMGYANDDDWPDLFIATDGEEDALWINEDGSGFVESARNFTVSRTANGRVLSIRGASFTDYDRDGDLDLLVAAAQPRGLNVFKRLDGAWFRDVTVTTSLAQLTIASDTYGIAVDDFNADGLQDIAAAHGAATLVQEQVDAGDQLPLRQADQLYYASAGEHDVEFRSAAVTGGNSVVSRGMIAVDLDNDGDADLVRLGVNREVRVMENTTNPEHWFGIVPRLQTGRIAIGARVMVPVVDGAGVRLVSRDGSFASSGDPRLRYYPKPDQFDSVDVTVVWPGGTREHFILESPSGYLDIVQGAGAT